MLSVTQCCRVMEVSDLIGKAILLLLMTGPTSLVCVCLCVCTCVHVCNLWPPACVCVCVFYTTLHVHISSQTELPVCLHLYVAMETGYPLCVTCAHVWSGFLFLPLPPLSLPAFPLRSSSLSTHFSLPLSLFSPWNNPIEIRHTSRKASLCLFATSLLAFINNTKCTVHHLG